MIFAWTIDELNTCCKELHIQFPGQLERSVFMNHFYARLIKCPIPETLKETLGNPLYSKLVGLKQALEDEQEVKAVFPSSNETRLNVALDVLNFFREEWNIPQLNSHTYN